MNQLCSACLITLSRLSGNEVQKEYKKINWQKEKVLLQIRQEGNAAENSCAVNSWVNIFILPLSKAIYFIYDSCTLEL